MKFQLVVAEPTTTNTALIATLQADSSQESTSESVGIGEPPVLSEPTAEETEQRTFALSKKLRCPVCQGLSVADSRSDAAVAMKNRIQELVEMGYSDDQM